MSQNSLIPIPDYIPNAETIAAMGEADRICYDPNMKRYSDANVMMQELLADA